jgi:hypothetical protein
VVIICYPLWDVVLHLQYKIINVVVVGLRWGVCTGCGVGCVCGGWGGRVGGGWDGGGLGVGWGVGGAVRLSVLQLNTSMLYAKNEIMYYFVIILNQFFSAWNNVCAPYIHGWKKFVHCKISAEKTFCPIIWSIKKKFSCMLPLWPRISINCV